MKTVGDPLEVERIRNEIERRAVARQSYQTELDAIPTQVSKIGEQVRQFEQQLDNLQAPKDITKVDVGSAPAPVQGHVQLRRFIGALNEAEMRIAEAGAKGSRVQTGVRFVEADLLKKRASAMAKGGEFLGVWDDAAREMRAIHDDVFRPLLESERAWGRSLAGLQREVNAQQYELLNLARHFDQNFMEGTGRAHRFTNWVEGKQVSAAKLEKFLDALDDPVRNADVEKFRRYLDTNRKLSETLERYYELTPDAARMLRDGRAAGEKLSVRLDDVADKMSFVNQIRLLGDNFGKELTGLRVMGSMAGAAVGGVPGAFAGAGAAQVAMNVLNPVPRMRMLAQIAHIRQRHDSWALRLAERLLGGKSKTSKLATAVEMAEGAGKRGRPRRGTPIAAMLYNVMQEDGDQDQQAAFDRMMERFRTATPETVRAGIGETAGWLEGQRPETYARLVEKALATVKAVQAMAPPPVTSSGMLFPSLFRRELSPAELDGLERRMEAVIDPKRAIERAERGELTAEVVDLLDEHHPHLMTDVRARVMERVNSDSPPSYERRIQLSILLKIPADPSMTPEYLQTMQELDAMAEAEREQAAKKRDRTTGRETGVNIGPHMFSRADRLELGEPPR